ncbi:ras GEF [Linderina pennispora]|uniref:Ras GEF n=1 Tax=Linderina pennispora TaxID=61395 RepID=A0A1Y1WBE2_9FUNG|nr:ras GEF [Linderina pennispora]ORX70843.1 ras GEF [Linderina pennispora]
MLLQQGPHGGIRRRGGRAIELLNPAFIDMMDIQPVDTETTAMLNKSNIRRRSFSLPPHEHTADWYAAIANIVASQGLASQTPVETKNGTADESTGPGMWWPLNDDNCSDEIVYDVHFSADLADSAALHDISRTAHTAPPTRADSPSSLAPPAPLLAESQQQQDRRRGSVSSHMRTTNGHAAPSLLKTQSSMSTLARGTATLTRSVSDMSADQSGSAANSKQQPASSGSQLIEMTMKTESGTITRCIKSMSLRLLVNRLASPEGNVDSDLLTDFLNSYRFFAHPIDVMRLLIVRYLNCFAPCSSQYGDGSDDDGDDSSFEEDGCRFLTINGWKTRMPQEADSVRDSKPSSPSTSCSRELPPLARKDGAIVQLRVMNIIKNWIKFHPHDFRLHHRLTRLLLLFLSHIQKQPGRADFVNSIRHKLSSGKLLAVENPPFMVSTPAQFATPGSAFTSQTTSERNSEVNGTLAEGTRSALDLSMQCSSRTSQPPISANMVSTYSRNDAGDFPSTLNVGMGHLRKMSSVASLKSITLHASASQQQQLPTLGTSTTATDNGAGTKGGRHNKKGSTSYFMSLFHHRSNKSTASSLDTSSSSNSGRAFNAAPNRTSTRTEHPSLRIPNGDMYANDFGSLVIEALANSGIPTPQTPVGRTLLNYSIANRNPYRINLHDLFMRVSATEFSLKGRVGNLETILHTMQGSTPNTARSSVSTEGSGPHQSGSISGPVNPVPNLTATMSWFNQATYWAVLTVLSEPTTAARALIVKQLIHIAFHCLARRNYYGAFEIAIALDNSAVRRLHETWALVPPLMKDIVAKILEIVQPRMNFRTYRESVRAALSGSSGPDEDVFDAVSEQIKGLRSKDMAASIPSHIVTASGISSAVVGTPNVSGSSSPSNSDEGKQGARKKSSAQPNSATTAKDGTALLTEQDCACIMYAIGIRSASFAFTDPSATGGYGGGVTPTTHTSVPVTGTHASTGSGSGAGLYKGTANSSSTNLADLGGDLRSRRARTRLGAGSKQSRPTTNTTPLPVVPFVAVHMTDLLHADEANATYSDDHPQIVRSRNGVAHGQSTGSTSNRRNLRCDSAAVSHVNNAQPLVNMQKFRMITAMLRELCVAQRTKYPYVSDVSLQQQIHSAVRSIKAQTNDIFGVVQDVVAAEESGRFGAALSSPFHRTRTGSSASRVNTPSEFNSNSFGYPLYQMAAMQFQNGFEAVEGSMAWDCADLKDNQELEQRLYDLSKWVESSTHQR